MINELRGRNLAHVGCTLGLVAGLIVGLGAAAIILVALNSDTGVNWATVAFFAITFGLGVLGYIVGGRVSRRLWRRDTVDSRERS